MNIKRFFAPDSRKALNMVREELGPEAIIISNRSVDGGVEILAAEDFDEELHEHGKINTDSATYISAKKPPRKKQDANEAASFAEKISIEIDANGAEKENTADQTTDADIANDAPSVIPANLFDIRRIIKNDDGRNTDQQKVISSMRAEINKLRGLMETQLPQVKTQQKAPQNRVRGNLLKQLERIGINDNLAGALVNTMKNVESLTPHMATRDALALLTRQIRTNNDDILNEGGIVVLIGPAGAGKTTTLAKLASQFIQRHRSKEIIMVSTDTYRVGAHEQLMAYGRLLGIPVLRARDQDEINQILSAVGDKKLVLVDSGSLTQNHLRHPDSLPTMQTHAIGVKHYLVMPASMQTATLDRIAGAFSAPGILSGGIITKVDDAANLGGALSASVQHKLPISYWCDGQKISSHLYAAKAQHLVAKAVTMLRATPSGPRLATPRSSRATHTNTQNHVQ